MKKLGFLSLLLLAVCTLFACSGQKSASSDSPKLKVVATNSIIADITKNITTYLRYLLEMLTDTIQPHGKEIPFQTIDALGIHHPLIDMIQRAPVDRPHLDGQQIERRSLADPPDAGKQQAAERSHYHNVGNGVQRARIMPQIHAIASDATRRCIFSDA